MIVFSCTPSEKAENEKQLSIEIKEWGKLPNGQTVQLFTLSNANGVSLSITNYGGIVTSIFAPDREGKLSDVTLGFDNLEGYLKETPYFGAIVGRYGNRIANGTFTLDGNTYTLAKNNGKNHLHGGEKGFDKVVWDAEKIEGKDQVGVQLSYLSKDREEGYPGNLNVTVTYTLNTKNQWKIDYKATTDKKTVVNLTNHAYFNLTGEPKNAVLNHELSIAASHFLPVDSTLIPLGELKEVSGTPFDFIIPKKIGSRVEEDDTQLNYGRGYDHCWVFDDQSGKMKFAASVFEPASGRLMNVYTTEPAVQFYGGNFLNGTLIGKGGTPYQFRTGMCLETQHYPNSPNQPEFPSTVLNPGEVYQSSTIYEFITK